MTYPVILAHGTLGQWDEVIFVSVAAVFLIMMGISWVKSRFSEPLLEDSEQSDTPTAESGTSDRFPLD